MAGKPDVFLALPFLNLYVRPDAEAGLDDQLLFGQAYAAARAASHSENNCGAAGFTQLSPLDPISEIAGNKAYARGDVIPVCFDPATHFISGLAAPLFAKADLKSSVVMTLSFGSRIHILAMDGDYGQTEFGYVHNAHFAPIDQPVRDYVSSAELFLNVPYHWGGRTYHGLDCSGLVQLVLHAAGLACPRNSGEQEKELGEYICKSLRPDQDLPQCQRGDLIFWKGHVGLMRSESDMIHANASHMMTAAEPLELARKRIFKNGGGDITAIKRL